MRGGDGSAGGGTPASTGTVRSSGSSRTQDCGGGMGIGKNSVNRLPGGTGGSPAIDTGGLTDKQLEMRIRES